MDDDYLYQEGFDDPVPYYRYVVHLLHESGLVKDDPEIFRACIWFNEYGYYDQLEYIIKIYPNIIDKARRIIKEKNGL